MSNAGRSVTVVVRAGEESGASSSSSSSSSSSDTLSSLSNILGEDGEAERKRKEEEEKVEKELMEAKRDRARLQEAASSSAPKVVKRASTSYDEGDDVSAAQRGLAAISYLLPLLDGLKYRFVVPRDRPSCLSWTSRACALGQTYYFSIL